MKGSITLLKLSSALKSKIKGLSEDIPISAPLIKYFIHPHKQNCSSGVYSK